MLNEESKKWRLNARNFIRGGIFAALPPALLVFIPILKTGAFPMVKDLKEAAAYALAYFCIYLLAHLPAGEKK